MLSFYDANGTLSCEHENHERSIPRNEHVEKEFCKLGLEKLLNIV